MRTKQPEPFAVSLPEMQPDDDSYIPTEQVKEFLFAITQSYSVKHACAMSGVCYERMLGWLNPSKKQYKPGLWKLFERAKAICYGSHIDHLNKSMDWKAHAFWLEHHEEAFAPKEKGASIVNQVVVGEKPQIKMDPDTIKALSEAYDKRMAAAGPATGF